jgi:DNA-binding winged helix-turn-helix (wHTH) protein
MATGSALGGDGASDFRLGDWLVQPGLCRISHDGRTVHLRPKVMEVLACLAGSAGKMVTRQALIDTVWAREFISDSALARAVFELRRALGDDDAMPRYVETIAKRGYRLVAPVTPAGEPAGAAAGGAAAPSRFVAVVGDGEIRLCEGENVIGRADDARVHVDSSTVSRRHARIVVRGDGAVIEDLGSKNGTEVDGRAIDAPVALADRTIIWVGSVALTFHDTGADGTTRTAADRHAATGPRRPG